MKTLTYLFLILPSLANAEAFMIDGNGSRIGTYLGVLVGPSPYEVVVSNQGYRFTIDRSSGRIRLDPISGAPIESGYSGMNCTGTFYVSANFVPGFVFPERDRFATGLPEPALFYVSQNPVREQIALQSRRNFDGTCTNENTGVGSYYAASPNSVGETGVPGLIFPLPIQVTTSWLFRDGFESLT